MNAAARHKLVWGWLRLFLGIAQMFFASAGLGLLLAVGLHPVTYAFVIAATVTTIASRLLFGGRPHPKLKGREKSR